MGRRGIGGKRRRLSGDEARERARELCASEGLQWTEPVRVWSRWGRWIVWTNDGKIGGNVKVVVNARSGVARRVWGPLPR